MKINKHSLRRNTFSVRCRSNGQDIPKIYFPDKEGLPTLYFLLILEYKRTGSNITL